MVSPTLPLGASDVTRSQRIALAMRGYGPARTQLDRCLANPKLSGNAAADWYAFAKHRTSVLRECYRGMVFNGSPTNLSPDQVATAIAVAPRPHTFSVFIRGERGLPCS